MMDRICYKSVLFAFLIFAQLVTLQGLRQHEPLSSLLPRCRGGGDVEMTEMEEGSTINPGQTIYPDLTVAILGKNFELYAPKESFSWLEDMAGGGCLLIRGVDKTTATATTTIGSIISSKLSKTDDENDGTDIALVETLAFLCDVVVVVLPKDMSAENDALWTGIVQGANRRKEALRTKSHLLLVSSQKMEFSQTEQQKALFASVETVTTTDLQSTLEKHLARTHVEDSATTISKLFEDSNESDMSLPFVEVVKNVYESLSADDSTRRDFQLRPISATINSDISTVAIAASDAETVIATEDNDESDSATKMEYVASPSDTDGDAASPADSEEELMSILAKAQSKLRSLEKKLEDTMLALAEENVGDNDNSNKGMPLLFLDFGNLANELLEEAYEGLQPLQNDEDMRPDVILVKIVGELEFLYRQQIQLMRDYYGRRYENVLDQLAIELEEEKITSKQAGERTGTATNDFIQSFQVACQHAIPNLCKSDGELVPAFGAKFDFSSETKGLVNDIMEATQLRMRVEGDDDDVMEESLNEDLSRWQKFHTSIPKWAKRLLARGVMLGVNYAQGWLAWQGLKRAAAERDRKMPKFPLF